ncbi:DUF3631 domain-containing protein [Streptomyces sp. SID13666]|uniref:DUF3631 domain-containing protein n=1 Tax=unclassified Streptomyces TaxID=2593676 RepID=UPI0013BFDB70|nr:MULTISPECIES: DUF3631 domain-containing protein [unclassified Streptomyces]NEA59556.1 DUF3631 domain-containing protein [Streptomyces sp. SID13666]NEA72718.1 DUF3631 domain-containing protein [Streptomyces sp. SID13588]
MHPTTPPAQRASPKILWPPVAIPGQPGIHRSSDPATDDVPVTDRLTGITDRVTGGSDRPPVSDPGQPTGPTEVPDAPVTEGAALLDELRTAITRYVVMPSQEALNATTLWVAATHLQPAWQHAPRLAVVGPVKRCGKSRLLDVLHDTVHAPFITINSTPAAIFRSITKEPPTLLVDEADTLFGNVKVAEKNEEMRGLLNAGHQRNRPTTRVSGPEHKPTKFLTFAMAALAGIGDLPDTIMDRAVVVRMRRRAVHEKVQPFRSRRDIPVLNDLRDRIAAWTATLAATAAEMEPPLPVDDRAADTWEPLVIVADLAGGHWPATARAACRTMTDHETGQDEENGLKSRILADIRTAFAGFGNPHALGTADLLCRLRADAEAPWAEYGNGGLSPRGLQVLLKDYGINSCTVRFRDGQRKGFYRAQFADAWTRYCPEPTTPGPTRP